MEWCDAKLVAHTAAKRALSLIAPCFVGFGTCQDRRPQLVQAREILYSACITFEAGDASEHYEDVYLPLFDALSYLNTALGLKPVAKKHVQRSYDVLSDLIGCVV